MTTKAISSAVKTVEKHTQPYLLQRVVPQTIAAKLGVISIIALMVMTALGVLIIINVVSLSAALQKAALFNEEAQLAESLFHSILKLSEDVNTIIDNGQVELIPQILAKNETLLADFSMYRSTAEQFNLESDLVFATENEPLLTDTRSDIYRALTFYREGNIDQARETQAQIDRNVTHLATGVERSATQRSFLLTEELARASILQRQLFTITIGVFAIGAILLVAASVGYSRSIVGNLRKLTTSAEKLSSGDYAERANINTHDEIGQLGQIFNDMAEAIEYRDKVQIVNLEKQIVETEAARAQAERSDQVKSAFLASMSHELRTPLNAVINFTRFVIDGDTGPVNEQQTELLTEVVGSAKHLLNLINDVLDMSKIEAGSLNLFIEENINLNSLLKSAVSTGQSLLAGKPVRLQTEIQDHLPLIRGDRQRILQILLNIVSNACKFTDEGEIKVSAYQAADEIILSIADTGPGIAPEDQGLVFEAFKQTQTGLRQGGGTGLGMPIARSLAEAHGGRLWLESEYRKGAKFYLALPVKSEALEPVMA